jgi:putative transposase
MKSKRKFSPEEKLQMLREAESSGLEVTLRKHNLARSLFYRWKNSFDRQGVDGLQPKYKKIDPGIRKLEKENERLRKVVSQMALELEIKEELLKKSRHR